MSDSKHSPSRRRLIQGSLAGAAYLSYSSLANAQSVPCTVGFNFANYTVNDFPVLTQQNPATYGAVALEHKINANYYKADSYVIGGSSLETRYLLCVDIGAMPASNLWHPVEIGALNNKNTITDIYVFNQANNELLFWHKAGSSDTPNGAMFIVTPAQHAAQLKLTIVARCSQHGYWGLDYNLPGTPVNYSTAVNALDTTKVCGGVPLIRPYIAPSATGGQGDLGVLHRPNIIKVSDNQVKVFLGGDINGTGRHPVFAENHYIMGGALFDQDSNLIGMPQTILYSQANNQQLIFSGFSLAGMGVKTIRAVMFDSLQGRLMSFLNI